MMPMIIQPLPFTPSPLKERGGRIAFINSLVRGEDPIPIVGMALRRVYELLSANFPTEYDLKSTLVNYCQNDEGVSFWSMDFQDG